MKIAGNQTMNTDLLNQFKKLVRNDRSGSFLCKRRREQAFTSFLNYVSKEYHKKKISNINNKHIISYTQMRLANGVAVKTIKTDLSAIRHYLYLAGAHADITNEAMGLHNLPKTAKLGITDDEFKRALKIASPDIRNSLVLMSAFGLRENEVSSISNGQLLDAKSNNYLHIKGKGGRIRNIPVENQKQVEVLNLSIDNIGQFNGVLNDRDDHFFADRSKGSVLKFKRRLSQFWVRHQGQIADSNRTDRVSNHDLRRSYAQHQYDRARMDGESKSAALGIVSKNLGHGFKVKRDAVAGTQRTDIVKVYVHDKW